MWPRVTSRWFSVRHTAKGLPCVYAIRARGTPRVKVGHTANVDARLSNLQVGSPDPLDIEFLFFCAEHRTLERNAHRRLREEGRHHRGEWFRVEPGFNWAVFLAGCHESEGDPNLKEGF